MPSRSSGPTQIGLEGEFYPTYAFIKGKNGGPFSAFPDASNPAISMLAYRGDLGLDNGVPQSVYALQKKHLEPIRKADGKPLRIDLAMGSSATLPDGLGTVTFDGLSRYVKLQVSHTPGQMIALTGVVLALIGLLGSLFIRPRRIWVRTRREGGRTLVEVAGLDRSAGGDLSGEIDGLVAVLQPAHRPTASSPEQRRRVVVTHDQFEVLSNQAVAACAVVYFLAVLAHLAQWAAGRKVEEPVVEQVAVGGGRLGRRPGRLRSRVAEDVRADGDVRPDRRRADRGGRVHPVHRAGQPRARGRPGAGALGQHVRVHPDGHLGRRRRLPAALPALRAVLALARSSPASC